MNGELTLADKLMNHVGMLEPTGILEDFSKLSAALNETVEVYRHCIDFIMDISDTQKLEAEPLIRELLGGPAVSAAVIALEDFSVALVVSNGFETSLVTTTTRELAPSTLSAILGFLAEGKTSAETN